MNNPCQIMVNGNMCGKLDTLPQSFRIDSTLYTRAYLNERNIIEVWVCKDCASRINEPVVKRALGIAPAEPAIDLT